MELLFKFQSGNALNEKVTLAVIQCIAKTKQKILAIEMSSEWSHVGLNDYILVG